MTRECKPRPALEVKLKRMRLRLEAPDQDTLTVRSVPANHRRFSKARTNLLIKRSSAGMPCMVCVDDDLMYTGMDPTLAQSFAAAPTQQGWRVLTFGGSLRDDPAQALEYALDFLEAEEESGKVSTASTRRENRLLPAWAINLTHEAAAGRAGSTLFRDEEIEQVAACTLSWEGRLPLILGGAGTGKSNLLRAVASLLVRRERAVLVVNLGAMMAGTLFESEREALLLSLLLEARNSGAVLVMEQAEWAVIGVPRGVALLRDALDLGVRLIATSIPEHACRLDVHPLASRLETVRLRELCASDTRRVLEVLCPMIAGHHGVGQIGAEVISATVERSLPMEHLFPGKAVRLLDAAAARASLIGAATVTLLDVYLAASRMQGGEQA